MLISFPLGIHPEVGLLDLMIVLFWIFWELPCCFPQWLCQFTYPLIAFFQKTNNYTLGVTLSFIFANFLCSQWLFSPDPLHKGEKTETEISPTVCELEFEHQRFVLLCVEGWACANATCVLGQFWEPKPQTKLVGNACPRTMTLEDVCPCSELGDSFTTDWLQKCEPI